MTAVDDCQTNEDTAWEVNVNGTAHIAEACASCGARLIAISTDYVFSGESNLPYGEHDTTGPKTSRRTTAESSGGLPSTVTS